MAGVGDMGEFQAYFWDRRLFEWAKPNGPGTAEVDIGHCGGNLKITKATWGPDTDWEKNMDVTAEAQALIAEKKDPGRLMFSTWELPATSTPNEPHQFFVRFTAE